MKKEKLVFGGQARARRCIGLLGAAMFIMFNGGPADAGSGVAKSSSMLSADAKTARAAGWSTERIHYDFLEDGELKGGVMEIPSAPPSLDAKFLAAAPLWNVVTLRDNGETDNRIDLVFVGDGYTGTDLTTYETHADNVMSAFFAEEPLNTYAELFNVHRVDVISNESGVDNDPTLGILKDTALDMQFWCSGTERLLCVNVSKALAAASEAPDSDQVIAIANSSKYGGAGYGSSDVGTLAGGSGSAVEIALHEFGHSFADLADEYDYGGPVNWPGGEPSEANVSIYEADDMAALSTKWFSWLDEPEVDTFEGANYSVYGIYRPTDNSKMRNLNRPFEQVNTEQFILNMYATVDPIDDASPTGTYTETDTLTVTPVQLALHALDVQWFVDGAPISGATSNTLVLGSLGLAVGTYTISVEVVDNTDWVRNEEERDALMTSTRSWTVVINTEPTCDDNIQNGNETDEDCGGPDCPACDDGEHCIVNSDCVSNDCFDGTCRTEQIGVLIPSRIEAEDYVRYYDTTSGNTGGGCPTGDNVDKEYTGDALGGGCNVGWVAAGEWLEFDVYAAETAEFDITARLAAQTTGRRIHIEIDGVNVTGSMTAPAKGWQVYEDRIVGNVTIEAGNHVVRVYMETNNLNLNYIEFALSSESGCTCPSGCDALVNISANYSHDGVMDTCYFLSGNVGNYINNWENAQADINGVNITNAWVGSDNYPQVIDGGYYLYVQGLHTWSHIEVKNW